MLMTKKIMISTGLAAAVFACGQRQADPVAEGEAIFKKYCILCHGADGKLGLNGAKDITASILTEAERIALVTNGKNTMTPFEGILSPEQIEAVVKYTYTLKP
jgi:cytochrome c6